MRWISGRLNAASLIVLGILPFATPARADGPPFDLPVECPYGDCQVVHYVDHDMGPGIRDYACGTATYNGHRGTDFSIPDEASMISGVPVLAAAAGVVTATRDGVEDIDAGRLTGDSLRGIECGNGLLIDHDDGWQSQYCHMRRGSLVVKKGDRVERGQPIGMIGMSGQATFPHLHFNLRKNEELIDPFNGLVMGAATPEQCGVTHPTLWTQTALDQLGYHPVSLYSLGFSPARPNATDIKRGYGKNGDMPRSAPEIYFWAYLIGVNNGDVIRLGLSGPKDIGGHNDFTVRVEDENGPRAKWFFVKMNRPGDGWPNGTYRGEVTFTRPGQPPVDMGVSELDVH